MNRAGAFAPVDDGAAGHVRVPFQPAGLVVVDQLIIARVHLARSSPHRGRPLLVTVSAVPVSAA